MKNIEIKCPLSDRAVIESKLVQLGAREVWCRRQQDTFFRVSGSGWLKLRETNEAAPELISYRRATDDSDARESVYDVAPVADGEQMKRLLDRVLPIETVVRKERTLWLLDHTRIHLDVVDGIGEFLELETVVDGITVEEAHQEASGLIDRLGLDRSTFIAAPYRDLLASSRTVM